MADELTIDIEMSDDEVKALEQAYGLPQPKDDPPPVKAKAADKTDKAAPDPTDLMRRLNESNTRLAEERALRLEAQRQAHDSQTRVTITAARAAESDLVAVSNAITKAQGDVDVWRQAHQAALEAGDYAKAAEAQEKVAEIKAKLINLQDGRSQLEDRARSAREKAETAVKAEPPKAEASDPFEAFLAQFGPKEQAWFRAHPECAPTNDRASYFRALAAHETLVRSGVKEGTDEYFTKLDEQMGFSAAKETEVSKADPVDDVVVETKAAKPAASPRVAAPVSRDTSSPLQRGPDGRFRYQLTREQADTADQLGISRTAYAKQLIRAQQEGRLGQAG